MATAPIQGQEQTEQRPNFHTEGEGTVFKGAPNEDFSGGKAISPEFKKALNQ
jgi:hypothetical protein